MEKMKRVSLVLIGLLALGVFMAKSNIMFLSYADEERSTHETQPNSVKKGEKTGHVPNSEKNEEPSLISEVIVPKGEKEPIVLSSGLSTIPFLKKEATQENNDVSSVDEEEYSPIKEKGDLASYVIMDTKRNDESKQVKIAVHVSVTNQELIDISKHENETEKETTTIDYSIDATVTIDNKQQEGELKRNHHLPEEEDGNVESTIDQIDYEVVGASVTDSKAKLDVISNETNVQKVYETSKVIANVVKDSNENIESTDIYHYATEEDIQTNNYKWKYTDTKPNQLEEKERFSTK